jgi:Kef-type K+ transport system membrane component KefB
MELITKIGIVLIVGFIGGKLAKLVKLPSVSGYLIAGLLLGPSFFDLVTVENAESLTIVNEIALAFIAFSIGSEFMVGEILKMGKAVAFITLAEVIGAIALVFLVMYFGFRQPFAFSIVIASMSAATAPAATLLVMKQYRAYGPMTKTLLPVVALDDVYGIIAFGIALSLAKLSVSTVEVSTLKMFTAPLIEIGGSLLLGGLLGVIVSLVSKRMVDGRDELQVITLAAIGVGIGIAKWLGLSAILTNIAMGTVVVNLAENPKRIFSSVNDFVAPFYVLFFTLAGASLDLGVLFAVGWMGLAYILSRAGGKIFGAWVGCKAMKAPKQVTKWLGWGLLPQGGISIGLSVIVRQELPQFAVAITTIIMFSVLVYETTGPIFAKMAITKAGEAFGLDRPLEPDIETDDSQVEPLLDAVAEIAQETE